MPPNGLVLAAGGLLAAVSLAPHTTTRPALAITIGPGPPRFNAELWLVQGRVTKRVVATKRVAIRDPTWSPRGRQLAFTVVRDPVLDRGMHVFVANANGAHEHRLVRSRRRAQEYEPAWSADGKTIAFTRSVVGVAPAIWLVRPDGRSLRRLTSGSSPAWSPDASRLVFSDDSVLWTIRRDGTDRTRLTPPPTDPSCDFTGGSDYEGSPDWSPDGGAIAFVRYCGASERSDEDAVYVIRADGTGLRRLTDGPADDSPSWAPSGRSVAFVRVQMAMTVPAGGGRPSTLFAPRRREIYDVAWER